MKKERKCYWTLAGRRQKTHKPNAFFSLIELLFAMAVVLLLVAGLAVAGEKALQAGRETSATQSVQSFAGYQGIYQKDWGGFSGSAGNLGGLGSANPSTCLQDQEMVTTTATNPSPLAFDTGLTQAGYTFLYKSGGTAYNATGTCGLQVLPSFDITANPVDLKTKSFCADNTGTYYLPAPTVMANSGAGCLSDNASATPVGQ